MIFDAVMSPQMFSGKEEMAQVRRGDPDALSGIIARHQQRLYRYLLHLAKDQATAEDLFQQTWVRVIEKIDRYDTERQFSVWLFSVAHNLAIDHFRSRRPTESLDAPAESGVTPGERLATADQNALGRLLEAERSAMLADCMLELPAIHREVLLLRFEGEMKLEEIAEVTGIPTSTVKSRLSRALEGLRAQVETRMAGREL